MRVTWLDILAAVLTILFLGWLIKGAQAEPLIVFNNKCIDETDWTCRNIIQGATRAETRSQVNLACKGISCPKIFSEDPTIGRHSWIYGAYIKHRQIHFAADPGGCPNARRRLRSLVLRYSR